MIFVNVFQSLLTTGSIVGSDKIVVKNYKKLILVLGGCATVEPLNMLPKETILQIKVVPE